MARSSGRAARDLLTVRVPDGSVLLHVPSGRYLRSNASAAAIAELLSAGHSAPEVARRFAASEGIALAVAEDDVQSVLGTLGALRRAAARPIGSHRFRGAARLVLQWCRLPRQWRWPTLRVAAHMAAVEIGLRTVDLRRLGAAVRVPLGDTAPPLPVPPAEPAVLQPGERRMLWALDWLDGRWFTPVTCLRRALVTGIILRRRHPVLRLGITGGGTTAHAWIEAGGAVYGMEAASGDLSGLFASAT